MGSLKNDLEIPQGFACAASFHEVDEGDDDEDDDDIMLMGSTPQVLGERLLF